MSDQPASEPATLDYSTPAAHKPRLPTAEVGRRRLVASTVAAGLLVLISLWRVHEFGIPAVSVCLALPLGVVGGVTWLIGAYYTANAEGDAGRRNVKWLVAAAVLAVLAGGLAKTTVVPRLYFNWTTRPALDAEVARLRPQVVPPGINPQVFTLNRHLGGVSVDVARADPHGGLWFRTGSYLDMIDQVSYGFYYRPPNAASPVNSYGAPTSPFGAAGMKQRSLGGGWYYFSVSDDSY